MDEPTSPNHISEMDLQLRDAGAIAYSKSLLKDGDTLVFIKYPAGVTAFDSTGFALATQFRVHSHKLLGTGSKVFEKMFDHIPQARVRRAHKLTRDAELPIGIRYVIDLTPPDEGDEAVEQISNLSCPKGILYWETSVKRCGISAKLVGGKDEVAGTRIERPALLPAVLPVISSGVKPVTNVVRGFNVVAVGDNSDELMRVIEESRRDSLAIGDTQPKEAAGKTVVSSISNGYEFPKEYCPIRHRAGIERLLQIIEGKEPRLDSAPKIWTVAMLSNFYDCTNAVVDAVCTWVLTQNNSLIMEILPEACLRLGLTLESQLLTRGAYSILVSEEAIHDAIQGLSSPAPTPKRAQYTTFGRLRDEIDEDTLNMVQHAGHSFQYRIDREVRSLVEENMTWLTTLPEHYKLQNLDAFMERSEKLGDNKVKVVAIIEELMSGLRHYVRGRLFFCLVSQLFLDQTSIADSHRTAEQYMGNSTIDFKKLYDSLSSMERVTTRQFWENVRALSWTTACTNNLIYDKLDPSNPHYATETNLAVANYFHIRKIWMGDLCRIKDKFNQLVIDSILTQDYMGGEMPREAFPLAGQGAAAAHEGDKMNFTEDIEKLRRSVHQVSIGYAQGSISAQDRSSARSGQPRIPPAHTIPPESPFFDLPVFLSEAGYYIQGVCDRMLSRGENRGFTLTDTLLCLTDDEYKYLPLFAGGLNDGTGGVYQDALPPAIAGPSGPGPAYHTGLSLASAPSSEVDFGDDDVDFGGSASTFGDWSRDVDNGFSDHIDRRRVRSEVSFGTLDFSDLGVDSEIGKGNGKGKAVEGAGSEFSFSTLDFEKAVSEYANKGEGVTGGAVKSPDSDVTMGGSQPAIPQNAVDSIMDDNFFCEDSPNDFDFEDDSGDETEKEI